MSKLIKSEQLETKILPPIKTYIDNHSVPNGGNTGQVLTKKSNTDGDVEWKDGGDDNLFLIPLNFADFTEDSDTRWHIELQTPYTMAELCQKADKRIVVQIKEVISGSPVSYLYIPLYSNTAMTANAFYGDIYTLDASTNKYTTYQVTIAVEGGNTILKLAQVADTRGAGDFVKYTGDSTGARVNMVVAANTLQLISSYAETDGYRGAAVNFSEQGIVRYKQKSDGDFEPTGVWEASTGWRAYNNWMYRITGNFFEGIYTATNQTIGITNSSGNFYRSDAQTLTVPESIRNNKTLTVKHFSGNCGHSGYPNTVALETIVENGVTWFAVSGSSRNSTSGNYITAEIKGILS